MILIRVEETIYDTQINHQIVETEEDIEEVKNELQLLQDRYRLTNTYYYYHIEIEDIETIKIDEIKGLTLKDLKRLLDAF